MKDRSLWSFLKKSRWVLLILAFFRLTFLAHHPVVNDEGLYVEYMQQQHSDFQSYKRISIDNNYGDRKPPLQYRIGSFFVDLFENPMSGPRLMQGLITRVGYFFLLFLLFRISGSAVFSNITGLLFAISPTFIANDKLVLTDGIIYGFGYILFFVIYETCRSVLKNKLSLKIIIGILLTLILARALMMTKQTGEIFVFYPVAIIFLAVYLHNDGQGYFKRLKNKKIRKHGILLGGSYGIILFIARFLYKLAIPESLYFGKHIFSESTGYVFGIKEVLTQLPVAVRIQNIVEGFSYHYVVARGLPTLIAVVLTILILLILKKDKKPIVFLGLVWLMVAMPYFILVKNFTIQGNKFMIYTSIVILITRGYALSQIFQKIFKRKIMLLSTLSTLAIIPHRIVNSAYYTVIEHSMTEVIGTYSGYCIERKSCNRGLHAQMDDVLEYLEDRDAKGLNSWLFIDPTRGTPGTTITIHQRMFPSQKIIGKITTGMLADIDSFIAKTKVENGDLPILFIFDGLKSRDRGYTNPMRTKELAESDQCQNKKVRDKFGMPITNFTVCEY